MTADELDELLAGKWQAWNCADCDPEFDSEGDEARYDKPYVLLLPEGVGSPDICPRCRSYLSFTDGADKLEITNTPYQRWAAKQRESKDAP